MRVPCDPTHTAKHDSSDDDRRQVEISSQELHHNNALLSARFEKFLLDLGNVDLDLVVVHVLVGTEHQIQEGSDDDHGHAVKKLKPTSPVMRPPSWYTTRAEQ